VCPPVPGSDGGQSLAGEGHPPPRPMSSLLQSGLAGWRTHVEGMCLTPTARCHGSHPMLVGCALAGFLT
jgi:hypothetical protein